MILDVRTDYSLLNSLIKIEDLIEFCKSKSWQCIGVADTNAGGLLDFYLSCKEANIKPIFGLRLYVTHDLDKPTKDEIILYPKNFLGYKALLKISTKASVDGFKNGQPNLLVDWLEGQCDEMLCVLPVADSPVASKTEESAKIVKKLQNIFGKRLYYGLYDRDTATDDIWLKKAEASKTPFLPLSGAKYLSKGDLDAFKTLRAIASQGLVEKLFETIYLDESLETATTKIKSNKLLEEFISQIDLNIPCPGLKVPKFKVPEGFETSYDYLVHLCRMGFADKRQEFDKNQCSERMKLELDVMKRCELADYFLLVYDICKYCDENDIPRGISRGSAGGSLVCYLLDVSRINPLEYNLLFERFLNEDRTRPIQFEGETFLTDAPDIDLDVSQLHRQQIIDFLQKKYGFVAKISTYTTLTSKNCLKSVIRAHGGSEVQAKWVADNVEVVFGKNKSIETTYKESEKFRTWADSNKKLYDIALKLEDVKKNCSIHAAGLLVSNEDISNKCPLILANHTGDEFKQDVCSAYSLDFSAKAGLIKIDLLGLRTLNLLQDTIKML